jgi:hypothetical protein
MPTKLNRKTILIMDRMSYLGHKVALINMYKASKLYANKLFIDVSRNKNLRNPTVAIVRYGDVMNPVLFALKNTESEKIFIPKIPYFKVAISHSGKYIIIRLHPQRKKIDKEILTASEALHTLETEKYYITLPHYKLMQKQYYSKKITLNCLQKNTYY